jgi:putative spermidine/putrescine transport system ATP-binding protein
MAEGTSAFISVRGLTKRYDKAAVIDALSFDVAEGEFLTFLGPSGCGKTTTLRCIAGFIEPDAGAIHLAGRDVTGVPPYQRNLGMVFQNYALFPHLSVADNVGFGLSIRGVERREATSRVERALEMVRLGKLSARYPKQLSGGQQQRVALARALVYEPRVLLLDEPLSNLDAKLRVEMRAEIRQLQRQLGVTALYVTHDQEEALSVSDRVMVINQGHIEQLSTPWELYNQPRTAFVASFVGTSNLIPARRSAQSGMLRIADRFEMPLPAGLDAAPESMWLVARPESVSLAPIGADGADGAITGRLRSLTLLGATLRAEIAIADDLCILVDMPHGGVAPTLAAGDEVLIRLDPARVAVIPR